VRLAPLHVKRRADGPAARPETRGHVSICARSRKFFLTLAGAIRHTSAP
jgi:hypothetical protein